MTVMAETENQQEEGEEESQVQQYEEGGPATRQPVQQQGGSDLPVKEGAAFGVIAVVATYLAHLFLTVVATAQTTPLTDSNGDPIELVASWQAAGWSYLSAFGVGFEADGEITTLGDAPNHAAAFSSSPFFLSGALLFLVSVGAVVAAGYAVAKHTDADDAVEAAKAGVTIVPAYLVFAIIFAFVMTHTYEDVLAAGFAQNVPGLDAADYGPNGDDVPFGPSTADAAIYAGILFPLVFGVLGAVSTQWRDALDRIVARVA